MSEVHLVGLRRSLAKIRVDDAGARALVLTAFYGAPATRALAGYPGPFGGGRVAIADAVAPR